MDKNVYQKYGVTILSLASAYLVYKSINIFLMRKKHQHIPGPKPKGLFGFYLGNLPDMIKQMSKGKIFSEILAEGVDQYGPVVKYQMFGKVMIHTVDPDSLKEILVDEVFPKYEEIYSSIAYPASIRFLGQGLVTELDYNKWKKRRAIFNEAFHRHELKEYLSGMNAKAQNLVEHLRDKADGKTLIQLQTYFNCVTCDIIANVAFGMDIDCVNNPNNVFNNSIKIILEIAQDAILDPIFKYKPYNWKKCNSLKREINRIREIARHEILNKLENIRNSDISINNDILNSIFKNQSKNEEIDIENMIDDFITFFFAGQETTANTLAFTFLMLGKHPEYMEKVKNEIDSVIGSKSEISFEDLNKLEYTNCVLKEVLRLYPAGAEFSRTASKDFNINGLHIPKGSWLAISPYSSGRYKKVFTNALEFNPDRFSSNAPIPEGFTYAYFPFSRGPRSCIGQNFAMIEAKIIIAKLIQSFDIQIDQTQSFEPTERLTLCPKDGTRSYLLLRS